MPANNGWLDFLNQPSWRNASITTPPPRAPGQIRGPLPVGAPPRSPVIAPPRAPVTLPRPPLNGQPTIPLPTYPINQQPGPGRIDYGPPRNVGVLPRNPAQGGPITYPGQQGNVGVPVAPRYPGDREPRPGVPRDPGPGVGPQRGGGGMSTQGPRDMPGYGPQRGETRTQPTWQQPYYPGQQPNAGGSYNNPNYREGMRPGQGGAPQLGGGGMYPGQRPGGQVSDVWGPHLQPHPGQSPGRGQQQQPYNAGGYDLGQGADFMRQPGYWQGGTAQQNWPMQQPPWMSQMQQPQWGQVSSQYQGMNPWQQMPNPYSMMPNAYGQMPNPYGMGGMQSGQYNPQQMMQGFYGGYQNPIQYGQMPNYRPSPGMPQVPGRPNLPGYVGWGGGGGGMGGGDTDPNYRGVTMDGVTFW